MGESLDVWREFFRTTDTEIFEFIEKAITIAALDHPRDFGLRKDRIAEQLFSTTTTQSRRLGCDDMPALLHGREDCVRVGKESKAIEHKSRGDVERDGVDINPESYLGYGGTEAFNDEIDEKSRVVAEILRIKQVLDNGQRESDSVLYESLRKLQMMTISMDILEKTKIRITLNCLRRKDVSTRIAQLAHNIIMGWKTLVKEICHSTKDIAAGNSNVDPCKLGEKHCADRPTSSDHTKRCQEEPSNKAGSIAKKNQRPHVNQLQATVKDMSSSINLRKIPANEIAMWKSEKERMFQNSNGIMGRNRPSASRPIKIICLDKVASEMKFKASKRNLEEYNQQAETAKRQRTVLALPSLPMQPASHKGPGPCARIGKTLSQMAKSRSQISSF
ncbi:hypothetical protein BT93_K1075 [Corymbia citriodora subsp. variegata]|nr:hypothetical protein BT93_K1075 [Corymbia citriodora subsp. variegata]